MELAGSRIKAQDDDSLLKISSDRGCPGSMWILSLLAVLGEALGMILSHLAVIKCFYPNKQELISVHSSSLFSFVDLGGSSQSIHAELTNFY